MLQGLDMPFHVSCTYQVLQESEPILPDREYTNIRGRCYPVRLPNKGRSSIPVKKLGSMGKDSTQIDRYQFPCRLVFICSIFMPTTGIDVGCGPFKTTRGCSETGFKFSTRKMRAHFTKCELKNLRLDFLCESHFPSVFTQCKPKGEIRKWKSGVYAQ